MRLLQCSSWTREAVSACTGVQVIQPISPCQPIGDAPKRPQGYNPDKFTKDVLEIMQTPFLDMLTEALERDRLEQVAAHQTDPQREERGA